MPAWRRAPATRDYSISLLWANLLALLIGLPVAMAQLNHFIFLYGVLQVRGATCLSQSRLGLVLQ